MIKRPLLLVRYLNILRAASELDSRWRSSNEDPLATGLTRTSEGRFATLFFNLLSGFSASNEFPSLKREQTKLHFCA